MIKSIEKIFIIMIIVSLAFGMVGLNYSYASEATISAGSAKKGEEFTVTVKIPSDAVAYQGQIDVTFSDGTTLSTGKLSKVTGIDGDFKHPGNMYGKFKAPSAGSAKIKVTGLVISGKDSNQLNSKTSLEKGITVADNTPAPTQPTPPPATTPNTTTTPSNSNTTTPKPKPNTTTNEPGYTNTGDKVYALEKLNVRKSASTSGEKIGSLEKDKSTKRISVGSNGWDKIEFNGGTGYVMSKYLTTQSPDERAKLEPKWTNTNDTVYSLAKLNVRKGWGTSYDSIGGLKLGEELQRIATGDNGWDKVKYEGQTAYVMSKYLTTDKQKAEKLVEEQEENNTVNNEVNNTVENTTVNETTTNENTNIAETPTAPTDDYNRIVEEVGVIPQVGKSTNGYIYYISLIAAIAMVCIIGSKIQGRNDEE